MSLSCVALATVLLILQFSVLRADYTIVSVEGGGEFCATFNPNWGGKIPDHAVYHPFIVPRDSDGCQALSVSALDQAVVARRGNCTFYVKALNAQLANASLLVIIYNETYLDTVPSGGDNDSIAITIPVVITSNTSGETILAHALNHSNLTVYTPPGVPLDPSAALIFLIAVTTVVLGSYLANTPWEFLRYGLLIRKGEGGQSRLSSLDNKSMSVGWTVAIILLLFALICTFLVLLYFFYNVMVYVVIVIYCIVTMSAMYNLLSPFVALIPLFNSCRLPKNSIPILDLRPDPKFFMLLIFCAGLVVWWAVERHAVYAWILQDILGFSFIVLLLLRLKFLQVWVVAVLMVLLFFYDIFMVFITPLFTADHMSIMVKAATGGRNSSETLPIVFIIPKFLPSELETVCSEYTVSRNYALLGYGDVGIPALLVTLALKFDYQLWPGRWRKVYFPISSIGYSVGLLATLLALALMRQAQPALLYLVPTTLGSVIVIALVRREFVLFFTGKSNSQPEGGEENDVAEHSESEADHAVEKDSLLINKQHKK